MFYVFKAKFHWNKDDFSLYTAGIGLFAVLSQLVLLPLLLQVLSLRSLLILAISVNSFHMVLYGLAWKPWVVYLALSMSLISTLTQTSIGSMVSHLASPRQAAGVVSGVSSLSAVLAPLTINPITAYFMSDSAPIHQPGAGIIVAGIVEAVACVLVLALPPVAAKPGVRALTDQDAGSPAQGSQDDGAASAGDGYGRGVALDASGSGSCGRSKGQRTVTFEHGFSSSSNGGDSRGSNSSGARDGGSSTAAAATTTSHPQLGEALMGAERGMAATARSPHRSLHSMWISGSSCPALHTLCNQHLRCLRIIPPHARWCGEGEAFLRTCLLPHLYIVGITSQHQ
ncbi:hypothetical protein CLOP_g12439 [Closterium sp. NIES-67]|nr:hypothetical protein CLOP_g12439 [Closterium sp. NIES-67]